MAALCAQLASAFYHKPPAPSKDNKNSFNIKKYHTQRAIPIKEDFIVIAQSKTTKGEIEEIATHTAPHAIKILKQGEEIALYEHSTDYETDEIKMLPDTNETQFVTLQNKSTPQNPETDSKKGLKPHKKAFKPIKNIAEPNRAAKEEAKEEALPKPKNTPSVTVWEIKSKDNNPQSIEPLLTLDLDPATVSRTGEKSKTPEEKINSIIPVSSSILLGFIESRFKLCQARKLTLIKILKGNKEEKTQELTLEENDHATTHIIALNKKTVVGWVNQKTESKTHYKLYVWDIKNNEGQKENPESNPFVIKTFIGTDEQRFDTVLDDFIKLNDQHMALITHSGHLSVLRHKPDSPTNVLAIVYTQKLDVIDNAAIFEKIPLENPNFSLHASEQSLWIKSATYIYRLPCSAWQGETSATCDSAPMAMDVE